MYVFAIFTDLSSIFRTQTLALRYAKFAPGASPFSRELQVRTYLLTVYIYLLKYTTFLLWTPARAVDQLLT